MPLPKALKFKLQKKCFSRLDRALEQLVGDPCPRSVRWTRTGAKEAKTVP